MWMVLEQPEIIMNGELWMMNDVASDETENWQLKTDNWQLITENWKLKTELTTDNWQLKTEN